MLGGCDRQNIIQRKSTALIGQTIVEDHAQVHEMCIRDSICPIITALR